MLYCLDHVRCSLWQSFQPNDCIGTHSVFVSSSEVSSSTVLISVPFFDFWWQTSLMYKLRQIYVGRSKFRLTIFPGSIDHSLVVAMVAVFLRGRN